MSSIFQGRAAATAAVLATAAVPATAAAGPRATVDLAFTTPAPAQETGLRLTLRYLDPADAEAKPPAITAVELALPAGTALDTAALPACRATDAELRARGPAACPPASKVGTGRLVADAGSPAGPIPNDLHIFNGPGEIVEVVTLAGTTATTGVDRLRVDGAVLRGAPPFVPGGPPDGRTAVREIVWDVPAHGRWLVTPPSCPPGGWTSRGTFGFSDGGTATVAATQPCRAPESPAPPPRTGDAPPPGPAARITGVRVAPVGLVRGRARAVRVRVLSPSPACRAGVTVRIGERRARTGATGRVTVRALVRRARTVRVRAGKPGCGRADTTLRVARPRPR